MIFPLFFYITSRAAEDNLKILKEAEAQTLLRDRLGACGVVYKAYKKGTGPSAQELKEKLFFFSKYFYTEKGLQSFLEGKEFFKKEKYLEAVEKLSEADEEEKDNTEVLHKLALANMWLQKYKVAHEQNQRARQINPLDVELVRDKLAIEFNSEDWKEALVTAKLLEETYKDTSALTLYMKAVALIKTKQKEVAEKALASTKEKNKKYPEIYYWQGEQEMVAKDKERYLLKYEELCKNRKTMHNERDMSLCTRVRQK